jgi:hypothetical protein
MFCRIKEATDSAVFFLKNYCRRTVKLVPKKELTGKQSQTYSYVKKKIRFHVPLKIYHGKITVDELRAAEEYE